MTIRRLDNKIDPATIAGPGAAVGDTLVWDGTRWVPGPPAGLAHVDTAEPPSFTTGSLWYDTDDTC